MPNVSYCVNENEVHYNPYVPPYAGFCKLILDNGETVELEGSGQLTESMISSYKYTLVSAEIGTQCTSIGDSAFINCEGLESIDIPNSVTSIGNGAFNTTGLRSCTIPSGVTTIGSNAFLDCNSLTSIDIPNGVTRIGQWAFYGCYKLRSIVCNATTAPTIASSTFRDVHTSGTLRVPIGSSGYDVWMRTGDYYLGKYNWTKVEQ